jgi:hypothetical protein
MQEMIEKYASAADQRNKDNQELAQNATRESNLKKAFLAKKAKEAEEAKKQKDK